ncbi:MAG: DUF167 family protein [Patescibacteria group bacterium]
MSVTAEAKVEKLEKTRENYFQISVREPAERNRANNRVLELLADYLKIPRQKIHVINGHHSPSKLLSVLE